MFKFGVDIGGTDVKLGLIKGHELVQKAFIPTLRERPHNMIIEDIAKAVRSILEQNGLTPRDLVGVGVGMPGTIDSATGEVFYSNNIAWSRVPLGATLSKLLDGVAVKVENDANVAGLGESLYGAGKNYKDSVMLTLGTGVGAGIVIDGKIFSGFKGAGAELGHMVIVAGGEQCSCGRKGCLEAYASATALIRETKLAMQNHSDSLMHKLAADAGRVSGRTSFDAAKQGDKAGKALVDTYIAYLAEGIANVVNAFRPNAIILGGGVSNAGDFLIKPLKEQVYQKTYSCEYAPFDIVIATLGNDAGMYGAASLFD